jgi:hypothetical protein
MLFYEKFSQNFESISTFSSNAAMLFNYICNTIGDHPSFQHQKKLSNIKVTGKVAWNPFWNNLAVSEQKSLVFFSSGQTTYLKIKMSEGFTNWSTNISGLYNGQFQVLIFITL